MKKEIEQAIIAQVEEVVKSEKRKLIYAIYEVIQARVDARHRILDNPTAKVIIDNMYGEKYITVSNLRGKLYQKNIEDYSIIGAINSTVQ